MSERKRGARDVAFVIAVGVGYLAGAAVALWLAWLALAAFLLYGFEAIKWVLR